MSSNEENIDGFVEPDPPEDSEDFYVDSPKGVIREESNTAGVGNDRGVEAPQQKISDFRDISRTDPHVKEALSTKLDWVLGDGYNISPRNLQRDNTSGGSGGSVDIGESGEPQDMNNAVVDLRVLLKTSNFWVVFTEWVKRAQVDGHAFMELVVEDGKFKPKVLPTEDMRRKADKFGQLQEYLLEPEETTSGEQFIRYDPHEIAELYFEKHPNDDFGRSDIEPIEEQADMLRDMEIDYSRFIATKAYPPILWKLGTDERNWTEDQISSWMNSVQNIGPDTMLAAPHDVDTDIVGTTSTSSTSGAMKLEQTFKHFENRVVTGLGVPRVLMNMDSTGQGESTATMPSFKRRVSRRQERVKTAVEQQIFKSLLRESIGEDSEGQVILPEFQFGEHSSAEKRLEMNKLLQLFNNGLLTPDAFAERAGLDPNEIPEFWNNMDQVEALLRLEGTGDNIQNPSGGSPTDTQGGTESAGGEVESRQDPEANPEEGRNRQPVTEDEN